MDSHRVSLLARRCGVRREQISGDLGQAWLASDSCPGSRSNEPVKLLWILSEPENGVGQKMLDKLTQTSDFVNRRTAVDRRAVGVVVQLETVGFCSPASAASNASASASKASASARGRLLSPSGSPLGRAASLALAHAASGLPRLSIACAQCQALVVKRQGKKNKGPHKEATPRGFK